MNTILTAVQILFALPRPKKRQAGAAKKPTSDRMQLEFDSSAVSLRQILRSPRHKLAILGRSLSLQPGSLGQCVFE